MANRFIKNTWAMIAQLAQKEVYTVADAGVPVDGVAGTGAGFLGPGSLYIDITNKKIYINGNTKLSPTWKIVTSA